MEVDDNTVTTTIPGTQSFCVAEAAHALCAFFAKREEYQIMNQWWNWVGLYTMARTFLPIDTSISINLTNKSEAMEVDDIDYEEDGGMGDKSDLEEKLGWKVRPFDVMRATAWHAARAACRVLTLRPAARKAYVQRLGLQQDMVPWVRHPWLILEQEERSQCRHLRGMTLLWETEKDEFELPTCEQIRLQVPVHPSLAHLGGGILLPRRSPFSRQKIQSNSSDGTSSSNLRSQQLILTPTTTRNLCLLGVALSTDPHPPPILICGPRGAGKSSLVRELAQCCNTLSSDPSNQEDLLELHVDEETDSKTLLGSYTTTDIPGEFTWRRGALTQAVREGKWVLLEDVDSCPIEIQAALIKLLEERILPLGIGKNEKCHPNFRLFGTCTTDLSHSSGSEDPRGKLKRAVAMAGVGGKKILHPSLWRKVHVDPLPYAELKQVARSRFASIPESISDAALTVFRSLDKSGRIESSLDGKSADGDKMSGSDHAMEEIKSSTHESSSSGPLQFVDQAIGRHASVRDFMKLVSRISSSIHFEPNVEFATESQRTLCLAETVDVFAMSCPTIEARREFVIRICAPVWNISPDLAWRYIEKRQPSIKINRTCIEVGRATIAAASLNDEDSIPDRSSQTFTETNHVLRLMESAGVCIAQNEAVLLVGETGVGKTTVIQRLAKLSGHELVVQNLSLQTDSTDLLGGFRPLDMRHIARRMYLQFVDIFVTWFSRSQNLDFLNYVAVAYEKGQWKRLSQCFRRAAQMGMNKVREEERFNIVFVDFAKFRYI
jgi:midasin